MASTTSATTIPTSTSTNANNGSLTSSGPTSSPLLFFVALGFGVVFTNLWIIVGVKYCFRYNQRNRNRVLGEDGQPIDLMAMPRQQRRRREKKLMTMDEVNERFPLTKYKAWRSRRAAQGLSTAGGVTAPPSRAASVKDVEGVSQPIPQEGERHGGTTTNILELAQADHTLTSPEMVQGAVTSGTHKTAPEILAHSTSPASASLSPDAATTVPQRESVDDEDDEEDPIRAPVRPEDISMPGDTCAICIDNLEDDEDVRGLTCGHAFHAACVDPWLTSRRACCPLCKADYYVPKPRNTELDAVGPHPQAPGMAYMGSGRGGLPFRVLGGPRFLMGDGPRGLRSQHTIRQARAGDQFGAPEATEQLPPSGWRSRLPQMSRMRNPLQRTRGTAEAQQAAQEPTPGALEAGIASTAASRS